jgi:hypothetical protein
MSKSTTPRTDANKHSIDHVERYGFENSLDDRVVEWPILCEEIERELAEAREQRDVALSDLEFRRELYVILAERCDRRTVELAETRNQRNTLAEVLERVNECLSNAEDVMHGAGSDDVSRARKVISDTLAAAKGGTL